MPSANNLRGRNANPNIDPALLALSTDFPPESASQSTLQNKTPSPTDPSDAPSEASPSPSVRQRLRDHIASPPKRQRTTKSKLSSTALADVDDLIAEDEQQSRILDRKIRWLIFLYHSSFLWLEVLREVYGDDVPLDDRRMKDGRSKIRDCEKNYQYATLERMEAHVNAHLRDNPLLGKCDDDSVYEHFRDHWNTTNFLYVWHYMNEYVDVERSSEIGKYYMQSMYANLAVEMKRYIDRKKAGDKPKAREELISFYDKMTGHEDYEDVSKEDFHEIQERVLGSRKRKVKEDDGALKRFRSMGPVPKKTASASDDGPMF